MALRWWRAGLRKLIGLFVDDGGLALAAVIWPAIVWLVLPLLAMSSAWRGAALFIGLAVALLVSCRVASR